MTGGKKILNLSSRSFNTVIVFLNFYPYAYDLQEKSYSHKRSVYLCQELISITEAAGKFNVLKSI